MSRILVRCFALIVSVASFATCSDFAPFGGLRLSVTVEPESLIPYDSLLVRIVIHNPSAYDVAYEPCPIGFELVTASGEVWGGGAGDDPCFRHGRQGNPAEDALVALAQDDGTAIPARDSLVVTFGWRGLLQETATATPPPGPYTLRAVLGGNVYQIRSATRRVTILPWSAVRVVQTAAAAGPVEVVVGGRRTLRDVQPLTVSRAAIVPAGPQVVELRAAPAGPILGQGTITLRTGREHWLGIRRSDGALVPLDVSSDTPPTATEGRSGLRVVHLAESAAEISISWTAPDGQSATQTFPLSYGTASPYRLGGAGTWQVRVVSANGLDTLYAPGPLPVQGGETRSLVLMAAPSGTMIAGLFAP